ncbi:MAG: biopolymer transporter ExbD [Bacteroidales bacterium]|nr:biopolymer transporter ExbD [Bacteroidales bacterium]
MAHFKKEKKGVPAVSTASLPDVIFMLLFFFMVTTVMRETTLKVVVKAPKADQVKKLEKKSLVSFIYIGKPTQSLTRIYGTLPRIQLNDQYAEPEQIREYIAAERARRSEAEQPQMTVSLKVDGDVEMGIVTDVKQELRKASALKINYSTLKGDPLERQQY